MAKSPQSFNKKQREKDKQKKIKDKRERMEERKHTKANSPSSGIEIDWSSAPVNNTLSKNDELKKAEVKDKHTD